MTTTVVDGCIPRLVTRETDPAKLAAQLTVQLERLERSRLQVVEARQEAVRAAVAGGYTKASLARLCGIDASQVSRLAS